MKELHPVLLASYVPGTGRVFCPESHDMCCENVAFLCIHDQCLLLSVGSGAPRVCVCMYSYIKVNLCV